MTCYFDLLSSWIRKFTTTNHLWTGNKGLKTFSSEKYRVSHSRLNTIFFKRLTLNEPCYIHSKILLDLTLLCGKCKYKMQIWGSCPYLPPNSIYWSRCSVIRNVVQIIYMSLTELQLTSGTFCTTITFHIRNKISSGWFFSNMSCAFRLY